MSVVAKLLKRRKWPVVLDGETVHIRALLTSELTEVMQFRNEDESVGYCIGCALLNEDGSTAFTRAADEAAKQFGKRILDTIDLPTDTRSELVEKIMKLSNGPDESQLKALIKN